MTLSPRLRNIISGLIALVLVGAATTVGIKYSFGALDDGFELQASFQEAGQGLVEDSDVKLRGLNVGHVQSIELVDGRALVTMFVNDGVDVPRSTTAVIRPKTLFGEKFVDLVPGDLEGTSDRSQLYADGDEITQTTSAVELERVLAATYPILRAIHPDDIATVLNELATAADGMGPAINRSLVNGSAVLDVQVENDANTRQFLEDLADLTGELADRAPDLMSGARDLNVALPVLTRNGDNVEALLVQLQRLSDDLSGVLERNTAFIDAVYGPGMASLDTLFANQTQIVPLLIGVRQYAEVLARVGRIPVGDGTVMGAVMGVIDTPSDFSTCIIVGGCPGQALGAAATASGAPGASASEPPVVDGHVSEGTQAILDILGGLFGGRG